MSMSTAAARPRDWPRLGLLWLLGIDLRLTILAVPPVLPLIHRDLHLDEKMVAALTGLPLLLFGIAAVPGSLLIARIGARRAVIIALVAVAVGSALRGAGPSVGMLFVMTAIMGAGVAVMQPALPTLVGLWFPTRISLATGLYANGLLIGETIAASVTIPLVLPLLSGSWQGSFVFWSAPVLATALLVLLFTPHAEPSRARGQVLWWPDWHRALTWQLGFILGGTGTLYFGANAFLPDYLHSIGRPEWLNAVLTTLNAGQLPASVVVIAFGRHFVRRRMPFVVMALLALISLASMLVPSGPIIVAAAGMIGFATSFCLILTLALPPLLAASDDVHRLAAGMLALGYTITCIVPYVGGAVWDALGVPEAALLPGVAGVAIIASVAATLRLDDAAWQPSLQAGREP
jgi:MFS transporter, CP family, cyanate transporter